MTDISMEISDIRHRRFRSPLRAALQFILDADARHRQQAALALLDDRMMMDIGIGPADIARELRTPART